LCLLCAGWAHGAEEAPAPATWREAIDQGRGRLASSLGGFQLSGFADAQSGYDGSGRRDLNFGAAEVDLSGDLTHDLQAGAAVVRFPGMTKLTVGFLDYHPFGGRIAPHGQLPVEEGFHVQVGRFDVPFGNDYPFYASKDSVSISRPLTTAAIMGGGYNDAGVRVLGNNGTMNFNVFMLQGFNPGRLVGGRIGLTPFSDPFSLKGTRNPKPAEIGFSWFYDADSRWRKREAGMALDLDGRVGRYYARAEYLVRTQEPLPGLTGATTRRGWHLTQEYALAGLLPCPATAFLRVERVGVSNPADLAQDTRLAMGLSGTLAGILQVKLEGQHYLGASPETRALPGFGSLQWYGQLVAVF
jgi:hypothetical protein